MILASYMSYSSRILPKEEWHRLVGTEAEPIKDFLDPNEHFVLVVEKNKEIIGSWVMMLKWHAECVWISPEHRGNPVVAGRLMAGMKKMARNVNAKNLVTSSMDGEVTNLIMKHLKGVKLPGEHYVFPVE